MPPELISILVLVAAFVITTTLSVSMGLLAFAAAFLVGTLVGGMSEDDIFAGFPGDLFVVLVGVTFLFAIARANGTTDWLVRQAVRLVGGRIALIPWVMFGIGAVLTAIGAVSPAAAAIVAPIALNLAAQYRINPLLMGAMVVHGTQAGSFSPISIYGSIVNGVVERSGLPGDPVVLFLGSLVVNAAIAAVVFVVFGGLRLRAADEQLVTVGAGTGDAGAEPAEELRLDRDRVLTLTGLVVLVVTTLGFGLDVGLVAMTISVVLSVLSPEMCKQAPSEVAWPTVLLICGVLTYVGVLREMGTIDYVGNSVAGIGVPLLAALLLCYIGAIVSAFASSVGLMGALIPLAVPFLQTGSIGAIGMITALAIAATVVDVSPFSTNGAIVLANAKGVDRDAFFRQLMLYGAVIVAVVPAALWLVLVLPGLG
ncbi:transporter, UIT1 family (TC 9.B.48) [Saccharopolyspora kobensis]|uniref:Transporter, UIT1 family n=1 Tax=Saccharopolyspora kobensis TaxID=146035 RepID=A0A1H5T233_9PSEU|nr:SLC13 family permease [Saccharopolyspora kobensis]SEF56860.1 transporter, UIT1 family (TC 9.B.48) [Saccharopolyspora kobensis]SFC51271.1 transporter, UIT1 family [Saccharopolyspora kobensis]